VCKRLKSAIFERKECFTDTLPWQRVYIQVVAPDKLPITELDPVSHIATSSFVTVSERKKKKSGNKLLSGRNKFVGNVFAVNRCLSL
jgi:hypothetical protein